MSTIHFLKQFSEGLAGVAFLLAVLVIPILILITIVGFIFRRSRWIAPVWIFFAVPVLLLLLTFSMSVDLPQMVRSLFNGDRNVILLSLCEPALGIAFLQHILVELLGEATSKLHVLLQAFSLLS